MKTLFTTVILLMAGIGASAQEVSLDYNEAGEIVKIIKPTSYSDIAISQIGESKTEEAPRVSLYPNPVTDFLSIDLPYIKNEFGYTIIISDLQGKKIRQVNNALNHVAISLEGQTPGTYLITVIGGKASTTHKIIKE